MNWYYTHTVGFPLQHNHLSIAGLALTGFVHGDNAVFQFQPARLIDKVGFGGNGGMNL
jgi:hypothetical protein